MAQVGAEKGWGLDSLSGWGLDTLSGWHPEDKANPSGQASMVLKCTYGTLPRKLPERFKTLWDIQASACTRGNSPG